MLKKIIITTTLIISITISSISFASDKQDINQKIGLYLAIKELKWNDKIDIRPACINCQLPSFTLIFNQSSSSDIFKAFLNENVDIPSAAKIHSLLGLYILNDPEYDDYSKKFFKSEQKELKTSRGKFLISFPAKDYMYRILKDYNKNEIKQALVIDKIDWNSNSLNK